MSFGVKWTAIVLTCSSKDWTHVLQKELEIRQSKGYIDKETIILTVEDPKSNVGSGGATVNALLTVAEYISAQKGYTVVNPDVLKDSYILILHNGRSYPYDSCGRAFITMPVKLSEPNYDGLICNVDLLMKNITEKLAVKASPGVWISSTDMILSIPHNATIPWKSCDAAAITVPSTPQYCKDHGVYKIDKEGYVEDILYKMKIDKLEPCERPDGSVPVVCSIVYLSYVVAEKLLSFYMKPPLDACTYMGVDSGEPPIQLSLYFDVLLPMTSFVTEKDFISGERSGSYGKPMKNVTEELENKMKTARSILWKELHGNKLWACMIEDGTYHYLTNSSNEHKKNILNCIYDNNFKTKDLTWTNNVQSYVESSCNVDGDTCVINSMMTGRVNVGSKSVICHSNLHGRIDVGKDCFISGLKVEDLKMKRLIVFGDALIVQGFNIHIKTLGMDRYVLTTHGRFDNIQESDDQSIMTAKLFPVFHATDSVGLREILWLHGQITDEDTAILNRWRSSWRLSLGEILSFVSIEEEFKWRRELFYGVSINEISNTLTQQGNKGFRCIYNSAAVDGFSQLILLTLDKVAYNSHGTPGIAARTLANIADNLGCMAGTKGGLRSGPAANKSWAKAFHLLETGELSLGVEALAKERSNWLERPDLLVRAARHYEGAAQILIRQAVMTAKKYFNPEPCPLPSVDKWVMVECPARIDVSGGWSDTPPITYEHGGAVTTVALQVNGKRPVGAKAKRISEPQLVMVICGNNGNDTKVICKELSDLEDYYQPHAPGALLKSAFLCADIVNLQSEKTLKQQLLDNYGSGFEIHSWSNLPHGSGMGTSSILSGAVMSALLRAAGKSCDKKGLIHAVLYLEQLLTTGGGWQDQVGGLTGSIQLGLSDAHLPLYIDAEHVVVSEATVKAFNNRIVLIYTGKTRLARNLLQDVVRNWYARNPYIVETEDALVALAHECAKAFKDGDLQKVGSCLDRNWQMKKRMAPGCETAIISRIMAAARPFAHGMCMAGAGGGGFLYVLAKDETSKKSILDAVKAFEGTDGTCVYEAAIDTEGLIIKVEE
ncbi:hypothetical protein KUTeg_019174 [Tegillarca granosa]|uniref:L-fucose kinase n=1 Tax=Tegillarca granosa TaxID=220873 RepID=A0ABQ9EBR7_TEGGR|nr:hypothetical protein KUTeg_019174 [Tegillarca granosa]